MCRLSGHVITGILTRLPGSASAWGVGLPAISPPHLRCPDTRICPQGLDRGGTCKPIFHIDPNGQAQHEARPRLEDPVRDHAEESLRQPVHTSRRSHSASIPTLRLGDQIDSRIVELLTCARKGGCLSIRMVRDGTGSYRWSCISLPRIWRHSLPGIPDLL